ncbi:hypothetical protein E1A91_A13G047400v1 [Gossypium mustelinum]|uniref:Uncharacterized protein n=1 Tax=Gossypium mustelinum TaxID=34275 RepID=A0A5D2WG43_GOSMU|nr:hypothetical protein E1A91_A13G047400v1 [Gossypium mustelinum]
MNPNDIIKVSYSWANQYISVHRDVSRVIIQFDNFDVVKAICYRQLAGASISLVKRIQHILSHEDKRFVQHTLKKNNQLRSLTFCYTFPFDCFISSVWSPWSSPLQYSPNMLRNSSFQQPWYGFEELLIESPIKRNDYPRSPIFMNKPKPVAK